jgi:hypothetical protein
MTTPAPAPEPIAEQGTAIVATPGHFAAWAEKHLEPYLADLRADITDARTKAGKALAYAQAHAAQEEALAGLLVKIVSAADPAAGVVLAELAPEAKRVLAETERLVAEFAGPQM